MDTLLLKLQEIANWNNEDTQSKVSIPALQRGLVWKPKQIELLWDSLMRGIPIGSFVVCKQIESQKKNENDHATYHLLDGQQRANAIQLGFDDFSTQTNIKNRKKSILWLDISPGDLPRESSRNFLFRVTTTAHPWGYTKGDNEGYLGAKTIRDWLKKRLKKETADNNYIRPRPEDMQPIEAKYPIPVSLLNLAFDESTGIINRERLIKMVAENEGTWVASVLERLQSEEFDLTEISDGIATARNTTVLTLLAPSELLKSSKQENNNSERADITNIEHLFQRLNQQGTRLDGEELTYSLIKAYWPEISNRIDEISQRRMPCSRLISLAFRVICTEMVNGKSKLASGQSVSTIRRLAKDDTKSDIRLAVTDFINSTEIHSLEWCCSQIDQWLGTTPQTSWGLPPVLRSSIAYSNQDLYLLLLLLAKSNNNSLDEHCCQLLTGIITYSAWFGKDQHAVAEKLYKALSDGITIKKLHDAVFSARSDFHPLHSPEAIEEFVKIPEPSDEKFSEWNWWQLIANTDEIIQHQRHESWWGFLNVIRERKDFILYAQRKFIAERFPEYDPARKDLWEAHNRPWDYDHILPHAYTYNIKSNNQYMNFCNQWRNTVGNFRAWPFEDNRSDQAIKAGDKLNEDLMEKSFIIQSEMGGFNQDRQILANPEAARNFSTSCKSRIIRMYKEWFDNLLINSILFESNKLL